MPSTLSPVNSRSISPRRADRGPSPAGSAKAPSKASTGTLPQSPANRSGNRPEAMRGNAGRKGVGGAEPVSGQGAVETELARQARQEPGRAHVRDEADADLRHGKGKSVARHPMGAMDRDTDTTTHDDAVDERHVRFAISFDQGIQRVFGPPIGQRGLVVPGAPEVEEGPQVAAGR